MKKLAILSAIFIAGLGLGTFAEAATQQCPADGTFHAVNINGNEVVCDYVGPYSEVFSYNSVSPVSGGPWSNPVGSVMQCAVDQNPNASISTCLFNVN